MVEEDSVVVTELKAKDVALAVGVVEVTGAIEEAEDVVTVVAQEAEEATKMKVHGCPSLNSAAW